MKRSEYEMLEEYMISCMTDSAHDKEHIYRVLYVALDIAQNEKAVDRDILITACLLHDIGRQEQFADARLDHAEVGAEKARCFLTTHGYSADFADRVASCIAAHRFRTNSAPESIEAQILFDADKIDVTGTIGIARTIFYKGQVAEPLYTLDENGSVLDGTSDTEPSFFQEYKYKLEKMYTKFYTRRGAEIAGQRQQAAISFYNSMLSEIKQSYSAGIHIIDGILE